MIVPNFAVAGLMAISSLASAAHSDYWCPVSCEEAGYSPEHWTRYTSMENLLACDHKAKLLDFSIHTVLDEDESTFVVFACSYERGVLAAEEESATLSDLNTDSQLDSISVELDLIYSKSDSELGSNQSVTALGDIQSALVSGNDTDSDRDSGAPTSLLLQYGEVVVGVFVGAGIDPRSAAIRLGDFTNHVQSPKMATSNTILLQLCGKNLTADHTMGVVSDTTPGKALYRVQTAMKAWWNAECAGLGGTETLDSSEASGNSTIWLTKDLEKAYGVEPSSYKPDSSANTTDTDKDRVGILAECSTRKVVSGDSCASLATKCGITAANLAKYNPSSTFCSTLAVGQSICCSSGTLPDLKPKPNADGSCASYVIQSGDYCSAIAAKYGLTVANLESFNKNTWGWAGCDALMPLINMCLSTGTPALPAPIVGAICGPQKPGTKKPAAGTDMAKLNPCPLNACCNVWGNCGTTSEFCTVASLGNPGTTQPGKNSCISNCGTSIVNNESGPTVFKKIGYFEAWNAERPCLKMDVTQVPKDLTHLHFAFGDIGPSYSVSVGKVRQQFDKFVKMKGVKRVIAFGGWTASTDPSSYWIFREGVKSANRQTLANNLVKFAKDNNLDGIDIDWEYPGAPDIDGIPAGDPLDGEAYLALLKLIKAQLPSTTTLSIAIPSSYWYLKQFPMAEIGKVVDYMVFMTYDLHGQWDYGSEWSMPGCPKGRSCMRSPVNMTETKNALAMLTKSGVTSSKVIVGITSYGRSFRMLDSKCTGVQCAFVGPESGASKGRCTGTAGYISNAEIKEIIATDPTANPSYDSPSMTNKLRWGPSDAQNWVGWMDDDNKAERTTMYKSLNFGGTSDWAVDLDSFVSDSNNPYDPDDPDSKPGNFNELPNGFKDFTCDDKYWKNTDSLYSDEERWEHLKVNEAWKYAIGKWKGRPNDVETPFVQYISTQLGYPGSIYCGVGAEENGCSGIIPCDDKRGLTPGAGLVLGSFFSFNAMMSNFYTGISDADGTMKDMETFADTFAPAEEPDPALGWLLDFLGVGFGLAAGPMFQKVLGTSRYFIDNPDNLDKLQETVMSGVSFGMGVAKDHLPGASEEVSSELFKALATFTRLWKQNAAETQKYAFAGKNPSIKFLEEMIGGGKLLYVLPRSRVESEADTLYVLYGYLMQYAWSLRGYTPVLVKSKWDCDGGNMDDVVQEGIDPDDDDMAGICVDGVKYFLLYPEGKAKKCIASGVSSHWGGDTECVPYKMKVLPGMTALGAAKGEPDQQNIDDYEGTYGGITRKEIAKAIIARHKKTGNAGFMSPISVETNDDRESFWGYINGDRRNVLGALFKIPMCDQSEVWDNWQKKSAGDEASWPSYPCNVEISDAVDAIPWPVPWPITLPGGLSK